MVVGQYQGSLKAEHGTGRNMAPFVELEWGAKAYGLMTAEIRMFRGLRPIAPAAVTTEGSLSMTATLPIYHVTYLLLTYMEAF